MAEPRISTSWRVAGLQSALHAIEHRIAQMPPVDPFGDLLVLGGEDT